VDPSIEQDRVKQKDEREQIKDAMLAAELDLQALARSVKEAEANLVALIAPVQGTMTRADETELKSIRAEIAQIEIERARKTLETAGKAEQEIATLKSQIATLEADAKALQERALELRSKLDPKIHEDYAAAVTRLDVARADYTAARERRAEAAARLDATRKQLDEIEEKQNTLATLKAAIEFTEREAAEWRYLESACGTDGIQALELDAMGPSISDVANRLLSAAYGSRFSIEIRTTRIAGKGSKTKQVEDFAIVVHDNELASEQPLETLSGGEAVWIRKALYAAFAIIRDRTTGIRFLTAFQDEADGALDPEARARYFAMLEAEHAESGRRNTIIITHSPEMQESIGQRIEMRRSAT
jgi:DNA repair protein SbcC/Rad50